MAEEHKYDEPKAEHLEEKVTEKIHSHGDASSSSSSDSDDEKKGGSSPLPTESKVYRLFGREKPVHKVLGGGKRRSN